VVAISGGSYFPDSTQAAAAWIIESECGTQWIMGSLFVPGSTEDYSSYHSELTGLVASSITLRLFACGCPQPQQVIIGCDGKSALQSLYLRKDEINANLSNADLLSILADIWMSSTMRPYPVHVRGHQDQGHQGQLTRLEKLNVLMDKLATMTAAVQPSTVASLRIPFMGICLIKYHNRYIGGNLHRVLYNGIVDRQLRMYYERKLLSQPSTMDNVELSAFQHARSQVPMVMIKFISKWMSNTLATGKVLQ
jgi:hypothetical protein